MSLKEDVKVGMVVAIVREGDECECGLATVEEIDRCYEYFPAAYFVKVRPIGWKNRDGDYEPFWLGDDFDILRIASLPTIEL